MAGGPAPELLPTLTVGARVNWTVPDPFWGANVRVYYNLGANQTAAFTSSNLEFVRWPGGAVADEYNFTSNQIYGPGGATSSPSSNESDFAAWCRSVGCRPILQLPGEIDDPATAAYYVHYTVSTLRFHPAYWEIGNEPALWNHFGIPWASWNASQHVNATPTSYALLVQAYAKAIRAVDPTAQLIGLPGVGTGGYGETAWITDTVRLNGPNLSAVGIHVYPAGGATSGTNVSDASFLATLTGSSSLAYRVPRDRAAIAAACPRCSNLPLFVTELGSGSLGGPYQSYMAGFDSVPYLAAEIAQAVQLQVVNVDLFALQGNYNGSILGPTGAPNDVGTLYSTMLSALQGGVLNYTLSAAPPSLYVVPTRNAAGTAYALLAVNVNASVPIRLAIAGTGFPSTNAGSAWVWTSGLTAPISISWANGLGPSTIALAPRGVVLIEVA